MSYAIIGFGNIGQALTHAFARRNIEVAVASRRAPEALAQQARAIGPTVIAKSLQDASRPTRYSWVSVPSLIGMSPRLCRAGTARPSSTRQTRRLRWTRSTACCPPRSSPSSMPAPRS